MSTKLRLTVIYDFDIDDEILNFLTGKKGENVDGSPDEEINNFIQMVIDEYEGDEEIEDFISNVVRYNLPINMNREGSIENHEYNDNCFYYSVTRI